MQPSVLFVCLGNICRSPMAEAIFRRLAADDGHDIHIDSAGTGDWHVGEFADPRARRTAELNGCPTDHRARQLQSQDFDRFDHIVVMDGDNMRDVLAWPGSRKEKVSFLLQWAQENDDLNVPDPYYGEEDGFDAVFGMCHPACEGLLQAIVNANQGVE